MILFLWLIIIIYILILLEDTYFRQFNNIETVNMFKPKEEN